MTSVNLMSVGTQLASGRLTSAQMAADFGIEESWIVSRTGIRSRPRAAPGERLEDCATAAGAQALAAAGVDAADLDLVVVATITADELTPAAAPLVARNLGAVRAGAFDVASACTGFLTGLALAAAQIESGRARRILLIGSDFCSRFINPQDRRVAPLFADAAGAVVIGPGDGWVGPVILRADGDGGRYLQADRGEATLTMDGPEVFRHAVARMHEVSLDALDAAETDLSDIDLFVPHQANARITHALMERMDLGAERVVDCIAELGNSTAATLPLALAHAEADGRLVRGTRVLLTAFGAGFTWGSCVLTWGGPGPAPVA